MNRSTALTVTVTVLEPKEVNVAGITDEHIQRLDRDGLILLVKELQVSLVGSLLKNEPLNSAEATETASETHDMIDTTEDAQMVNNEAEEPRLRKKKPYHAHGWTISDRLALYKVAEEGMSLSTILEKGRSNGRQFSKKAYWRQLNYMGWSLKHGTDKPMVKMLDHDARWLAYQEKHKMIEGYDDDE